MESPGESSPLKISKDCSQKFDKSKSRIELNYFLSLVSKVWISNFVFSKQRLNSTLLSLESGMHFRVKLKGVFQLKRFCKVCMIFNANFHAPNKSKTRQMSSNLKSGFVNKR